MSVAVPSIIVWVLGIPLFALILILKERKALDSLATREKLGFLFSGYKHRFFYWEIIIMYRKIFLIFIQVFLIYYTVITQVSILSLNILGSYCIFALACSHVLKSFFETSTNSCSELIGNFISVIIDAYCVLWDILHSLCSRN